MDIPPNIADILEKTTHYAEWRAALELLYPEGHSIKAPHRIRRTIGDHQPRISVLEGVLSYLKGGEKKDLDTFPYLARHTLNELITSYSKEQKIHMANKCEEELYDGIFKGRTGLSDNTKQIIPHLIKKVEDRLETLYDLDKIND